MRDVMGREDSKTLEILGKLCMEYDRAFIDAVLSKLNSLDLHTNVKI
jgi:hypothetical protein